MREILLAKLIEAEELASQFRGGYSNEFDSATDFHAALKLAVEAFSNGDDKQLSKIKTWFLPTSCWDDFIGLDGEDLANQISSLINTYRNLNQ